MLKLGVITDEVSQSLEEAAAFAKRFELTGVELRSVAGEGPFEWTLKTVKGFQTILKREGLRVIGISSPLFKCDMHDREAIKRHLAGLQRCAEFCDELGCSLIRGFDFWEAGASVSERAERFGPVIEICRKYGLTCALEYDPSVHASTPPLLRELVDAIDAPQVRALFDPGNGIFSRPNSHPFPEDYETLKPVLCHIHIKDALPGPDGVQAVCIGEGRVNYPALLRRLLADGYSGYLMLETHYRLAARLTEEQLRLPGGQAFSDGAYAASEESMIALRCLIDDASKEMKA